MDKLAIVGGLSIQEIVTEMIIGKMRTARMYVFNDPTDFPPGYRSNMLVMHAGQNATNTTLCGSL